jgi:hypothetical protein
MKPPGDQVGDNCHQCAVAAVLELPIQDVPFVSPDLPWEEFHEVWDMWFDRRGIVAYEITFAPDAPPKGYTIGGVMSRVYENTLHSIVCLDGEPVWDPKPEYRDEPFSAEDVVSHVVLAPRDPSVLTRT